MSERRALNRGRPRRIQQCQLAPRFYLLSLCVRGSSCPAAKRENGRPSIQQPRLTVEPYHPAPFRQRDASRVLSRPLHANVKLHDAMSRPFSAPWRSATTARWSEWGKDTYPLSPWMEVGHNRGNLKWLSLLNMAVGQNQWYHFGEVHHPILVYSSEDWDVHWGYGILTHGHMGTGLTFGRRSGCIKFSLHQIALGLQNRSRRNPEGQPIALLSFQMWPSHRTVPREAKETVFLLASQPHKGSQILLPSHSLQADCLGGKFKQKGALPQRNYVQPKFAS